MRLDEEFGRESFDRYLVSAGVSQRTWTEGRDPPDFELVCRGTHFAVEVTQIVGEIRVGKNSAPETFWTSALSKIVKELEEAGKRLSLTGCYQLNVEPVANYRADGASIRDAIFDYIRATESCTEAPEVEVWRENFGSRWSILKVGCGAFSLLPTYSSGDGAKWECEIQSELDRLVLHAVDTKREKTRHLKNIILILVDAFGYAASDQWVRAIQKSSAGHFCSVVRAYEHYLCQILMAPPGAWLVAYEDTNKLADD